MATITKQVLPGGVTREFRVLDSKGKVTRKIRVPEGTSPQDAGVPPNAVEFATYAYDDGSQETWKFDPAQQSGPNNGWVQVGATEYPDTPDAKALAQRFRDKQERADAEAKTAQKKADDEAEAKRKAELPQVVPGATSSEPMIPIQTRDANGNIVITGEKNPAYQTPEQRSAQLTPEQKAANEANIAQSQAAAESSRASTARATAETGKITREEAERRQYGGQTASENANALLLKRQQEWKEYTDKIKQDFDNRKIGFEEAQAALTNKHNQLSLQIQADQNKIAQRGQDITARGQSLDFATRMGQIGVATLPYMSDPGVAADIDASIAHMANPKGPPVQHVPATGRLQGMSPMEIVNAALAGISPSASPAPPGGIVAPPAVPGQVATTAVPSIDQMGPMPTYGAPGAITAPAPQIGGGATIPAGPSSANYPDEMARRLALAGLA